MTAAKKTAKIVPLKTRTGAALEREKARIAARAKARIEANPALLTGAYGASVVAATRAELQETSAASLRAISSLLAQGQPSGGDSGSGGASVHVFAPEPGCEGHNIRVVEIEGAPWFAAVDVGRALGMSANNGMGMYLKRLKERERQTLTLENFKGQPTAATIFPLKARKVAVINEPGLYKLVMRSSKAAAEAWQDWIAEVVLPAIRKDGGYVLGEEKVTRGEETIEDLEARLAEMKARKVTRLEEEVEKLRADRDRFEAAWLEAEGKLSDATMHLDAIHPALRGITARSLGETIVPGTVPLRELCASLGNPNALAGGDGLAADIGMRMSAAAV